MDCRELGHRIFSFPWPQFSLDQNHFILLCALQVPLPEKQEGDHGKAGRRLVEVLLQRGEIRMDFQRLIEVTFYV